jgi:hypothetical protein
LDPNGTWSILEAELESEINLTGVWRGELSEQAFIGFHPPLPCGISTIEITFIQNGNDLTGTGTFSGGCFPVISGSIAGKVDGNTVSFRIISPDEVNNFVGTITEDYRNLMGTTSISNNYSQAEWSLFLQ